MQKFLKQTLDSYFSEEDILNHQIFNELSLYIYSLDHRMNDLYVLAKILDEDSLQKLIAYYDGDLLRLPSREAYKTSVLTALCFWLKTFKGYTWTDIKDYLNIPDTHKDILSSISIGGKINKIKETLGQDIITMLENIEEKEFVNFYNEIIKKKEEIQNDRAE
jgi:hypothetical protein